MQGNRQLPCACSAVFEAGGRLDSKASEKGLLQLLFDVRFLWDALSGGRPLEDPQADPPALQPRTRYSLLVNAALYDCCGHPTGMFSSLAGSCQASTSCHTLLLCYVQLINPAEDMMQVRFILTLQTHEQMVLNSGHALVLFPVLLHLL